MGYKDLIPSITKFKKYNLPPQWNGPFTLLFNAFYERVTGSDCKSKSFETIHYGLYHGINPDYGSVLWAQLTQSTNSTTRHNEISCGRFWTLVVQCAIAKLNIPVMPNSLMSLIATFHTTKIIVTDNSKFSFVAFIPESMYSYVYGASKIIGEYKKHPVPGPRVLTPEMQHTLDEADELKKGGNPIQLKVYPSALAQTPKKQKTKRNSSKPAPSSPK